MSIDIALDPKTGDLAMNARGAASFISGVARVRQQVEITLRTWLGEWFLDTTFGVPYLQEIMVKGNDQRTAAVDAIIRSRVQDVPGVRRVTRVGITLNRPLRALRIDLDIESALGPLTVRMSTGGAA